MGPSQHEAPKGSRHNPHRQTSTANRINNTPEQRRRARRKVDEAEKEHLGKDEQSCEQEMLVDAQLDA